MKGMRKHWFLFLLTVLLAACTTTKIQPKQPVVAREISASTCIDRCQQRMTACKNECRDSCPQCCQKSRQETRKSYSRYMHEQIMKGGEIIRQLKSYRDPLKCIKTSCNCCADYRVCMQACGKSTYRFFRRPVCK